MNIDLFFDHPHHLQIFEWMMKHLNGITKEQLVKHANEHKWKLGNGCPFRMSQDHFWALNRNGFISSKRIGRKMFWFTTQKGYDAYQVYLIEKDLHN